MYYEIAGLKVHMNPIYQPLINQVIPYQVIGNSDSLDCEIPQGEEAIERYLKSHPNFTIGQAEYLLYGAYFYDSLLEHQGILLHSSCVVYQGNAYLFSGPCGAGKSTHTNIWTRIFSTSYILNDDKPAIRYIDGKLYAFGTPFSGKTNKNINKRIPIAGISFIKKSQSNHIKALSSKEALILFLSQTLKPYREERLDQMVSILEKIVNNIPIYELSCNMEDEAAFLSFQVMKAGKHKEVVDDEK